METWRIKPHKNERLMINHANVSSMMAAIINKNMATMLQLQTDYGMEDAMNLYEIIIVENYNQYVLNED